MTQKHADGDTQFDFLFRYAAEGILLLDAAQLITRLNPAAAVMLGLGPDVVGRSARDVFKRLPDLLRVCGARGELQATITLPHKRIAAVVGGDQPDGGRVIVLHDVTERAALDVRREVLIRQIAHDLRNPLNAISGYAELVTRFGDLTDKQTFYLNRVQQTVDKLYELAETLIDLAWVEAGMGFEHRPIRLAPLIREVVAEVSAEAATYADTIIISVQDPLPSVLGDARRLKQALRYLLENALRYSPVESSVVVHAWQSGAWAHCSVADHGIGIQPDDQERIWDRMWRADDERVRARAGGGIGLTFARAIVQRHGGRIYVESTPEQGTTVTFLLPLAEGW